MPEAIQHSGVGTGQWLWKHDSRWLGASRLQRLWMLLDTLPAAGPACARLRERAQDQQNDKEHSEETIGETKVRHRCRFGRTNQALFPESPER